MIRRRLTVFTRLPFTNTFALRHVTPGTLRTRILKLRRLTHPFAGGSRNAFAAGIRTGFGLTVVPGGLVAGGGDPGGTPGGSVGRS